MTYLDTKRIIGKKQTKLPRNPYCGEYGKKIPSSWLLQLDDKRWRRVYVACWSNSGSPYIIVNGKREWLGKYQP
jgi:hypothetical protein